MKAPVPCIGPLSTILGTSKGTSVRFHIHGPLPAEVVLTLCHMTSDSDICPALCVKCCRYLCDSRCSVLAFVVFMRHSAWYFCWCLWDTVCADLCGVVSVYFLYLWALLRSISLGTSRKCYFYRCLWTFCETLMFILTGHF